MDPLESPESLPEKNQIYQLEQKLVKFKKFVVSLRNERTQLQEQVGWKTAEFMFSLLIKLIFCRLHLKIQR